MGEPLSQGSLSKSQNLSKSQTLSVEKRILNDSDAFKKTCNSDPSFSMRMKLELVPGSKRSRPVTEYGSDIDSKKMDVCRMSAPVWTVKARWKDLPDLKAGEPGPGHYPEKTLLSKSHPTLPVPPQWKLGTQERNTMPSSMPLDNPSPDRYDVSMNCTRGRVRYPSIKGRINEVSVPGRKGIWATIPTSDEGDETKMYDVTGRVRRGGVAATPKWTMPARPESSLIPKGLCAPGPGHNNPNALASGQKKRPPNYSFGTASRWGKDPEPRPY